MGTPIPAGKKPQKVSRKPATGGAPLYYETVKEQGWDPLMHPLWDLALDKNMNVFKRKRKYA